MAVLTLSAAMAAIGCAMAPSEAIDACKFMAGSWRAEIWGGTFEETWSAPLGGTMQGMGRHFASEKVGMMEFMSIEPVDGKLTMFILVGAPAKGVPKCVPFVLTKPMPMAATFVNDKNDFPQRISYKSVSPTEMECVLEMVDGKADRAIFNFKRVP